jgi:DNA polymerase-3 subunit gamma/tau
MTIANELLDAGNSPAQLARQFVRYLRNCVIAKIAGVEADGGSTELLQISSDEQRRAGRSAALFTEEELTRFLQVMLRTFDELGYRQEQRFHFELGLLKLVHLQRLLPVEELLSRFPTTGGSGGTESPRPRVSAPSTPVPRPAPAFASPPPAPSKPAFSPFAADRNRKTFDEPAPIAPRTPAPAPPQASAPVAPQTPPVEREVMIQPELPSPPAPAVSILETDPVTEITAIEVAAEMLGAGSVPAAILEPETAPPAKTMVEPPAAGSRSAEDLQRLAIEALSAARSQGSAADALADAEWTVAGDEIRVQTELSKTMLPMVINADADRIVRTALRSSGAGQLKLVLLPGAANAAAVKKPRAAKTGSAQAKAMDHPVVQQAQRLFNAEIRNVIDLSDND